MRIPACTPVTLTGSGAAKATPGMVLGWIVNASSSLVVRIRNGGSGGNIVLGGANGIALTAGAVAAFGAGVSFPTDIYCEVVSGSGSLTLLVD